MRCPDCGEPMKIIKQDLREIIWKCYSDSYELVEFKRPDDLGSVDVGASHLLKEK